LDRCVKKLGFRGNRACTHDNATPVRNRRQPNNGTHFHLMKPSIFALLMTVVAACAAEPTVTEEQMPGGVSVIKIAAPDGRQLASYRINMSTRHYPTATADDKLVKRFRSWRFVAFLCFTSNQCCGQEFCPSKNPVSEFQPTSLEVKQ
jgi:hypothetical protein